jgi:hypothetical protein
MYVHNLCKKVTHIIVFCAKGNLIPLTKSSPTACHHLLTPGMSNFTRSASLVAVQAMVALPAMVVMDAAGQLIGGLFRAMAQLLVMALPGDACLGMVQLQMAAEVVQTLVVLKDMG